MQSPPLLSRRYGSLSNEFGYFDDQGSFVITRLDTPRPWVNVLANPNYGVVLSHLGGGFSWRHNCQLFRLTRWEQDLAEERYGRWLYLAESGHPERVWSASYAPTNVHADSESVTQGLGFTTFERHLWAIHSRWTVFVPRDAEAEVWILELTNQSDERRTLRVAPYVEWHLGNHGEWHREFHRLFVSLQADSDAVYAWKRRGLQEGTRVPPEAPAVAYLRAAGFDQPVVASTDKTQWLGRPGNSSYPAGLLSEEPPRPTERWDDPVGVLRGEVTLKPGETKRLTFTLGASPDLETAQRDSHRWLEAPAALLEQTVGYYQATFAQQQIETPDEAFNVLTNLWLPYQAAVGRMEARCAYYQQGGAFGYRDQLQDSLLFLELDPDVTLKQLIRHAEAMYEDGGVRHWWHPDSSVFVESHHSDTCCWLAFGVLQYLQETNDLEVLKTECHYLDRTTQVFGTTGTLLDHMVRGIRRALSHRSERGLPLIGAGDWNDGLSHAGLEGKGESVWMAMFVYGILADLMPILGDIGELELKAEFEAAANDLRVAVETHGWEGDRYLAGTSDDGRPFGSKTNDEGCLFLNPQTWAVITGIADPMRAEAAMQMVERHLVKPYGALLLAPAFENVNPYVGYITRYAPGLRENGGVYSHASTWAVQAFSMLDQKETAWSIWSSMAPPRQAAENAERYAAEPYVTPGNIDGPDSPYEGKAGWTWYTGSAAWLRRVGLHRILGVRATREGLVVDPQLPDEWPQVQLRRKFRGDEFQIRILGQAPYRLEVDGLPHEGPIRASGQGLKRHINVMGS